ncbi:hypothetical protein TNCV_4287461 [Trichonephila clavipes]|uniref:Uncharacterized protein n=1 Tax=Trichonephila clavipes TaxID=2585209 RepID=A0A8X6SAL5_TRICX|nr:hypothetical protein TNCV_4287461 [Trichonephila clavipes]
MFNVSPIRHTVHIMSIGESSSQTLFSASEAILATSASIMCLKSGRSAGSGGTYTQYLMDSHRQKSHGVRLGEREGHGKQALS